MGGQQKILDQSNLVMFGLTDNSTTERQQLIDDTTEDEVIESKIKECQRENGRYMVSTSS